MDQFYLDTSIWIDFYERRGENGKAAADFMFRILSTKRTIFISDFVLKEMKCLGYSQDEINKMLSITKPDNIRKVHLFKEQLEEANRIAAKRKIPRGDAIHGILARDNNAILISRDRDFEKIKEIVLTKKPEEII